MEQEKGAPLTTEDLAAIEARLAAATRPDEKCQDWLDKLHWSVNGAPTDIRALLAEVRRLRADESSTA